MDNILKYAINSNPIVKQINEGFDSVCNKFEKKETVESPNPDQEGPRKSFIIDEASRLAYEQQKKLKEQAALERNVKRAEFRSNIREKYGLQQNDRDKELLDPNFVKERKLSNSLFRNSLRNDDTSNMNTLQTVSEMHKSSSFKATTFKDKVKKLFRLE